MARSMVLLLLPTTLLLLLFSSSSAMPGSNKILWPPACRGTVGDCTAATEEEFELASESSRRILATSNYISYEALKRDSVPCSRRGASYYNCQPGAQANPYTRGCSAITQCRS